MTKPQQPPPKPREQERATGWVVRVRPDGEIVVVQAVTAYESDLTYYHQQKIRQKPTEEI